MNGKKQTTLFQSWGGKSTSNVNKSQSTSNSKQKSGVVKPSTSTAINKASGVIDLCDSFDDEEDDDILFQAEESIFDLHKSSDGETRFPSDKDDDHVCDISIGVDENKLSQISQSRDTGQKIPGFDYNAGKLWIYPTNYPVRDYQFNIVQQALFKNTMVTLPTGLGKTFIAAVVMYNFYRWYPLGKVVFMAPTKPLVAQQIEACYNIMGIPQEHTAEMTGTMGPQKRESAWHGKRVFFLTPQVLTNDLSRGSCPGSEVKCLVIDEAHKALGNHAYCQVVRELIKYTENFRVLALSATPGSDIKSVQLVLSNLLISHIELRTEESIDIKQYSHERKVEKVVVPLGDELTKVKTKYIQIMDTVVQRLKHYGVIYNRETTSLSKFLILKAREAFRQNPPERLQRAQYGMVEGDFAMAMSLYHGYELLQLHGSRSLYNFLNNILTGDKSHGRTRTELMKNADFNDLRVLLSDKYKESEDGTVKPLVIGHPKMVKLQEIILLHFKQSKDETRVMIFSQYRDSVQEITDMLHVHEPMIKVMSFIGQASAGKSTKGFTQKEQLKVMKQFREGGYNTLVSTCVGEEGLDIGDVDLIICFDAHKSPIRLVQRMGRTGRKREGKIVMLVTEGKEEQIYNQSQYSKRSIHKAILNGARSLHFYQNSPRMVPEELNPAIHKMHITVKESFRTDKKPSTAKTSEEKKITKNTDARGSKADGDEIITLAEYRELEPWLVPEADIPKLPMLDLVCLPPKQEDVPTGALLSLSEWTPWQTTLQTTGRLEHTMQSKHLVELMEFIQLQQSLDPGDDPYGLEMAAYLNEEDILKPNEEENSKGTLLKFYKPTVANKPGSSHSETNTRKKGKAKAKTKVRRSDNLPQFEVPECTVIHSSSDDDLPAFDMDGKGDKRASVDSDKHDTSNRSHELDKDMLKDKNSIKDDTVTGKSCVNKTDGSKLGNVESGAPAVDMKLGEKKSKKRKRKVTGNQSVISVIADTDINDFDEPDAIMDHDKDDDLPAIEITSNNISKFFTNKSNHKRVETTDVKDVSSEKKIDKHRKYFIGPPPPIKELDNLLSSMETKKSLDIDLCELVKEWNMENKIRNYISLAPEENNKDMNDCSDDDLMIPALDKSNGSGLKVEVKTLTEESPKPESKKLLDECEKVESNNTKIGCNKDLNAFDFQRHLEPSCTQPMKGTESALNIETDTKEEINCDSDEEHHTQLLGNVNFNLKDVFSSDENSYAGSSDELPQFNAIQNPHKFSSQGENETNENMEKPAQLDDSPVFKKSQGRKYSGDTKLQKTGTLLSTQDNRTHLLSSESCFSDSLDDSLFKAVKTPHFPDINNPGTQVTFTQAFACIQSTSSSVDSGTSQDDAMVQQLSNKPDTNSKVSDNHEKNSESNTSGNSMELHNDHSSDIASKSPECFNDHRDTENRNKRNISLRLSKSDSSMEIENEQCNKDTHKDSMMSSHSSAIFSDDPYEQSSNNNVSGQDQILGKNSNQDISHEPSSHTKNNRLDENSFNRKSPTSSSEEVEFPDFDLGFNVDEDIIPPSPNANLSQASKTSRLSQTFRSSLMEKSQGNTSTEVSKHIEINSSEEGLKPQRRKKLFKSNLHPCNESSESENLDDSSTKDELSRKSSEGVRSSESEKSVDFSDSKILSNNDADNSDNDVSKALPPQNESKEEQSYTRETKQPELDDENVDDHADFNCSPMMETSFALLDEDLEDWITAGTDIPDRDDIASSSAAKEAQKVIDNVDKGPDNDNRKSGENRPQNTCKSDSVMENASVCDKGMSSEWFDDSFTCPVNNSKVETPKAETVGWLSKRSSTSTPLINSSTPLGRADMPLRRSNTPLGRSNTPFGRSRTPFGSANTPTGISNVTSVKSCTPLMDSGRKIQAVSPFCNDNIASKLNESSEGDDSFIVRRKKKVTILDSPESDIEKATEGKKSRHTNDSGDKVTGKKKKKSTFMLSSSSDSENNDDFDDSFLNTKNNYTQKKPVNSIIINDISDDDFEESFEVKEQELKRKSVSHQSRPSKTSKHKTEEKNTKPKRPSNPFIDEEAELSEENSEGASSDEDEGSDQDQYDESFIADSQQSQALDQTDMQALYVKSVKSPVGHRGGYKLKFDSRHVDVYSQAPREEESQYMEDSFCVGSEEESDEYDWLAMEAEESHGEVTMLHPNATVLNDRRPRRRGLKTFQTSRQRAIHNDRMKALSKIKAKKAGKITRNTETNSNSKQCQDYDGRPMSSRHHMQSGRLPMISENVGKASNIRKNRIQVLDESSSEEADLCLDQSSVFSPAAKPIDIGGKKRPRILSSSDEEKEECKMKNRISSKEVSHCDISSKSSLSDDFDDMSHLSIRKESSFVKSAKRQKINDDADEFEELSNADSICQEGFKNAEEEYMTHIKPFKNSTADTSTSGNKQSLEKETASKSSRDKAVTTSLDAVKRGKRAVIIVDSKELSGAQDVISDLRFKHNIHVTAASLTGCDYIVSNRMAVERKQWSEFSNGSNRNKLIERMTQLSSMYDRACLIVEKERVKPGEEKSKIMHYTKIVDKTCSMLLRSNIKVLFSDNQSDSAVLLSDLCLLEQRKGMPIVARTELSPSKSNIVKFFSSFPNVTYVNALNLCEKFSSIQRFLTSSISEIEAAGKMSKSRATVVYNYIRRDFDAQFLPAGCK